MRGTSRSQREKKGFERHTIGLEQRTISRVPEGISDIWMMPPAATSSDESLPSLDTGLLRPSSDREGLLPQPQSEPATLSSHVSFEESTVGGSSTASRTLASKANAHAARCTMRIWPAGAGRPGPF